jgi:outer membrane protein TolC
LFLISVLSCFLSTGPAVQAHPETPVPEEPDKAAEIKKLLQERVETLQETVKVLTAQYRAGIGDIGRVLQAQRDLLRATIELSDKPQERITALGNLLKVAEVLVKTTEAMLKAGSAGSSKVDVLQARAFLLEAWIELLREELKAKPRK